MSFAAAGGSGNADDLRYLSPRRPLALSRRPHPRTKLAVAYHDLVVPAAFTAPLASTPDSRGGETLVSPEALDVVCLSLEPWDEVWRRNQHLASRMVRLRPAMRLLFVELPVDMAWSLRHGRWTRPGPLRQVGDSGQLWAMTPRKWLPRKLWPRGDHSLGSQVLRAVRQLRLERPVLWINDSTYAPLIDRTGWPSVYDVTDDWLLVGNTPRERERQERNDALMMECADQVVVCSPSLAESRGRVRPVHLISNGVDLESLRAPTRRPDDLPPGPILLYQGTMSVDRLDLDLCLALARAVSGRATLVFVGPNSLEPRATAALTAEGAVVLGPRPYRDVPAYLQHADLLVVPHAVTPFVESLDPIKAREFLAVGRPVVSTPVAGFRGLDPPITAAPPTEFVDVVVGRLERAALPPGPGPLVHEVATWSGQAEAFLAVLDAAVSVPNGRR